MIFTVWAVIGVLISIFVVIIYKAHVYHVEEKDIMRT